MLTLDHLLINLIDSTRVDTVPLKDRKILNSLRQQLKRQYFFTEKQGNLLIKLLQSNKRKILNLTLEENDLINKPIWSQDFRVVTPVRRIYFNNENMSEIVVECINEKEIKQKLANEFTLLGKREVISSTSSQLVLHANEHNLVKLIELLKNDNFEIENNVLEVYHKITELIDNSENILDLYHERNKKLLDLVSKECDSSVDKNLYFLDRRIRYQYNFTCESQDSLIYKIANRTDPNVWIDETKFSLLQIFEALKNLKRFPILFVFDAYSVEKCHPLVLSLNEAMDHIEIEKTVGIYFRFDNTHELHKNFNQLISTLKFNSYLDETTNVAGIEYKNLPKFLFKTKWYPKTVITNISNLQRTKVFRYCDQVDLIISYSPDKPLVEGGYYAIM
jgi:hypothetical protein